MRREEEERRAEEEREERESENSLIAAMCHSQLPDPRPAGLAWDWPCYRERPTALLLGRESDTGAWTDLVCLNWE